MRQMFSAFWILLIGSCSLAIPMYSLEKRQSDQRIAELETLLALHKYGVGPRRIGGRNAGAGYGLIDFNFVGRKKKSIEGESERRKLLKGQGQNTLLQQEPRVEPLRISSHEPIGSSLMTLISKYLSSHPARSTGGYYGYPSL